MSIERTQYGTWRARWIDGDGSQRAKSFKRKVDAQRHLDKTRGDLQRGVYVPPSAGNVTVKQWSGEWLTGAMNLGQGGRDTYERDLRRYILPALGDLPMRRLTPTVIDEFLSDELERLAPSTVHRHYRTIRRMCEVAVDKGKIQRNPCGPVTPPKVEHGEMRFLTVEQVEALAGAIATRYRAWVWVAAYGGLRWSEGVGLRQSAVDGPRLVVSEQMLKRADKQWHRDAPKSKAGRRVVALPEFAALELAGHLDAWSVPGPDGLVFVSGHGTPLNGPGFTGNVFKPALRRAGIDPIRIHDLRHTAVAFAVAVGAHPKAIQARMGHASISVTLDRYGHLFPEMDETIAVGLDELRALTTRQGQPVSGTV